MRVRDELDAPVPAAESGTAAERYARQLASGRGRTPATLTGGD